MGGFEDAVLVWVHGFCFVLSWLSPKKEHDFVALLVDDFNDMVSEFLPSTLSVGIGLTVLYSQGSIQQEYSLACPLAEISVVGLLEVDFLVGFEILVDILEGRRGRYWLEYTEAQSMSLVGLMVGVLADDNNLDLRNGSGCEGVEDVFFLGVDLHNRLHTFLPDSYSAFTYL